MPSPISAVRAFQLTDASGHPLPSPHPIDLAAEAIPYGARVRFEVEAAEGQGLMPMQMWLQPEGKGERLALSSRPDGRTFSGEVRLPWGLRWGGGEILGSMYPPIFPGAGGPPIGAGQHLLRFTPRTTAGVARTPVEVPFRLGDPPSPGGAPPRIVKVSTGLEGDQVRLGQPWLLTAQVEDPDDDVLVVIFSVLQGDFAQWWFLVDDGTFGDQAAGDGVYSFLRIGGDPWERPYLAGGEDVTATLSVQAGDVRGNWSEPVVLDYRILTSQEPVWMSEPTPGAPNIVEVGLDRAKGSWRRPYLWARCDRSDAWVCARSTAYPDELYPLFDSGAGIHSEMVGFPPGRDWDTTLYAVPKSGPPVVGEKLAITCLAQTE